MDVGSGSGARIAIVHPWVVEVRGGERTFFDIVDIFPSADVFLLHANPAKLPPSVAARHRTTTFLDKPPYSRLNYRAMLPLLHRAAQSLDLSDYDVVVSSSFGWAHGVEIGSNTVHICYMHSPPRYLWGEAPPTQSSRVASSLLRPILSQLRRQDVRSTGSVNKFVANSTITADRIVQCYDRESVVVFPPVNTAKYSHVSRDPDGHLIAIGELVRYKRFDLAIEAARATDSELVLIGDGPERSRLEALAEGTRARFAGRVTNREMLDLMAGARALIHPGVEDFGIVMAEALAAGIPVIGPDAGGAKDIVADYAGSLVDQIAGSAYAHAVVDVDSRVFDDQALRDGRLALLAMSSQNDSPE